MASELISSQPGKAAVGRRNEQQQPIIEDKIIEDKIIIFLIGENLVLPGVVKDILGCRDPGSPGCSSAECCDACAGWTHSQALVSSCRGGVYRCSLEGQGHEHGRRRTSTM